MLVAARTVTLVRHGLTSWNAEKRWQGRRDIALSDTGREQARALARQLAEHGFDAVIASPLQRARETAEILAPGATLHLEPDLVELNYGEWEGLRDDEVLAKWPELRARWWTSPDEALVAVGGEKLADLSERVLRGFVRQLDAHPGNVLVVAHGGVNRMVLAAVLGLPTRSFWRMAQDPTCRNVMDLPEGGTASALPLGRLRLLNCTSHLA